MSDSTFYFSGTIPGYPRAFTLRAVVTEERLRIDYGFGLYHHLLEVDSLGYCVDVVLRDKKTLFLNNTFPNASWTYDKNVNPEEGRTLNYYVAKLISGAGDGILGLGITKPEWFEKCRIYILVTECGFYKFSLESETKGCLLLVTLNPKQGTFDIKESPEVRYIKT